MNILITFTHLVVKPFKLITCPVFSRPAFSRLAVWSYISVSNPCNLSYIVELYKPSSYRLVWSYFRFSFISGCIFL